MGHPSLPFLFLDRITKLHRREEMATSNAIYRKEPLLSKIVIDDIGNTKPGRILTEGSNYQDSSTMANGPMKTIAGVMGNVLEWWVINIKYRRWNSHFILYNLHNEL